MTALLRIYSVDAPSTLALPCPEGGHSYARVPHALIAAPISDAEKVVMTAILGFCRDGQMWTDKTDAEIGRACHKSEHAVQRSVRRLSNLGIIVREGNGHRRRLIVNIGFRGATRNPSNPATSDGVPALPTPPKVTENSVKGDGVLRQSRRGSPSEMTALIQEGKKETSPRRPATSDEPPRGASPPPARRDELPAPKPEDRLPADDLFKTTHVAATAGDTGVGHVARLSLILHRRAVQAFGDLDDAPATPSELILDPVERRRIAEARARFDREREKTGRRVSRQRSPASGGTIVPDSPIIR